MLMYIIAITMIAAVVGIDQWSKAVARKELAKGPVTKGPFLYRLVYNEGAFSGWLKKKPVLLKGFGTLATVFLLFMLVFHIRKNGSRWMTIGFSLLAGGAIGNLADRFIKGKVTDFFTLKKTARLYYNLADMAIFLGTFIVMLSELKKSSGN